MVRALPLLGLDLENDELGRRKLDLLFSDGDGFPPERPRELSRNGGGHGGFNELRHNRGDYLLLHGQHDDVGGPFHRSARARRLSRFRRFSD